MNDFIPKRFGLVFKIDNSVWLGEYLMDGGIEDASPISDHEEIYKDLGPNAISVVSIEWEEENEKVFLRDVFTMTVEGATVEELLGSGEGEKLAKKIFDEHIIKLFNVNCTRPGRRKTQRSMNADDLSTN